MYYYLKWFSSDRSGIYQNAFKYKPSGQWNEVSGNAEICFNGFHVTDIEYCFHWYKNDDDSLFLVACDGSFDIDSTKIAFTRIRSIKNLGKHSTIVTKYGNTASSVRKLLSDRNVSQQIIPIPLLASRLGQLTSDILSDVENKNVIRSILFDNLNNSNLFLKSENDEAIEYVKDFMLKQGWIYTNRAVDGKFSSTFRFVRIK